MKKYKYIAIGIIVLIINSCTPEIEIIRSYPSIQTLGVTNITEQGVIFNAEIKNESNFEILEYGFIWSQESMFDILKYKQVETIILQNSISKGVFSSELKYGMVKDRKYQVRSFIKTKENTIYGPIKDYVSKGGTPTKLIEVIPNHGVVGDTIQLVGENFSMVKGKNYVIILNKKAEIIKSDKTTITCIVPSGISISQNQSRHISLSVFGQGSTLGFDISDTKINSINPLTGTFLDEITITGENFSLLPEYNKVVFGYIKAPILSVSKNKLVVQVPYNVKFKSTEIKITIENKSDTYNKPFIMIDPKVLSVTPGPIKINQLITITGENLNPSLINNTVNFGHPSEVGEVTSGDKNHLVVRVPEGPFPNRKAIIDVSFANIYRSNGVVREIADKWVLIDNKFKFPVDRRKFANNVIIANDLPFLAAKYFGEQPHMVRLYLGDTSFDWARTPIINTDLLNNGVISTLSDGNDPYIYNHHTYNFWKFNENAGNWTQQKNFPGSERENITQFTINGEIFMGYGKNSGGYLDDMYKFSPITGKWTQVAPRPGNSKRNNTAVFVINNIAYMVGGATNSTANDCWAYNPQTDAWSQIADYPYAIDGASAFALDGEGYVTCGKIIGGNSINEVWKYNPNNNSWNQSESIGIKPRYNHFAFAINNKAYIGGGIVGDSDASIYPTDIYEFIK